MSLALVITFSPLGFAASEPVPGTVTGALAQERPPSSRNNNKKETTVKIWKGKVTGCAAVFTGKGKVQIAHHVRLDENGGWVPSMEVVLTKVN